VKALVVTGLLVAVVVGLMALAIRLLGRVGGVLMFLLAILGLAVLYAGG